MHDEDPSVVLAWLKRYGTVWKKQEVQEGLQHPNSMVRKAWEHIATQQQAKKMRSVVDWGETDAMEMGL